MYPNCRFRSNWKTENDHKHPFGSTFGRHGQISLYCRCSYYLFSLSSEFQLCVQKLVGDTCISGFRNLYHIHNWKLNLSKLEVWIFLLCWRSIRNRSDLSTLLNLTWAYIVLTGLCQHSEHCNWLFLFCTI